MQPINNGTVLITGASKGIGLAIAEEFASHGHDLILVARGIEDLERAVLKIKEKAEIKVTTLQIDLSENNAPQQLFELVAQSGTAVDILVNNAGVGMSGDFAKGNYSRMTKMLQLNMLALSQLTHLFLQSMLERKRGRILNIGSLVSYFTGAPNWSGYVASKHYVRAFSKGLSRELKGSGVAATLVSPGPTATDFVRTADTADMLAYQASRGPTVTQVARVAYRACQRGKTSAIPGMFNKILAFLGELHPRNIAFEVFSFLSRKKSLLS
jgi:short-subunit dehydrogenase